LQEHFAAARTQIAGLADEEARYVQFLESVIVQGLLQLLEPSATVYARSKDEAIAGRALDGAKKAYYDISGREVEIELDASLNNDLSGGVKLVSGSRRITLGNTLDERLRLLEDRVRHVGIDGSYVSDISILSERNKRGRSRKNSTTELKRTRSSSCPTSATRKASRYGRNMCVGSQTDDVKSVRWIARLRVQTRISRPR